MTLKFTSFFEVIQEFKHIFVEALKLGKRKKWGIEGKTKMPMEPKHVPIHISVLE